jgi:putative phage-type endonuclease
VAIEFSTCIPELLLQHDWLTARAERIGASDAPIICGISTFESPFTLFHKKRATLQALENAEEFQERMYWGKMLEPAIVGRFAEVTKRLTQIVSPPGLVRTDVWRQDPRIVATLDGVTLTDDQVPVPLEVKNVSAFFADEWSEAAPLYYQVQVQHQMMVTGTETGYIAALIGGNKFRWGVVRRDQAFIDLMLARELAFLDNLRANVPPEIDGSDATKELLAALYPKDHGHFSQLPSEAIDWDADMTAGKALESKGKEMTALAHNRFRAAMQDATVGVLPNGIQYTLKQQTRVDPPHSEPKISTFRVLRRSDKTKKA